MATHTRAHNIYNDPIKICRIVHNELQLHLREALCHSIHLVYCFDNPLRVSNCSTVRANVLFFHSGWLGEVVSGCGLSFAGDPEDRRLSSPGHVHVAAPQLDGPTTSGSSYQEID